MSRWSKAYIVSNKNALNQGLFYRKYCRNILELLIVIIKAIIDSSWLWIEIEEDTEEDIEE